MVAAVLLVASCAAY